MPSTFFGLNTAYTGLIASNAALNTTANNIANIETSGYSRQIVQQQAADAIKTFTTYGCAGAGVDTLGAERQRDEYYDIKYRDNNQKAGEYDEKAYFCKLFSNYLRDDSTQKGFSTIFSEMMANLETASTNSGDTSVLADYVGSASSLCEYFNILYDNMQTLQTDANDEVKINVDQINNIATQIASLNEQINVIEMDGHSKANELRDKRDLLVDSLSEIVDTKVEEYDVYDSVNQKNTGATRYVVKIAGGQTLVDANSSRKLECVPRESYQKVNQSDADGLYDVYWTDTNDELGIHSNNLGGSLKGLFDVRDGNNGEYFNGKVNRIDTANQTVKIQVTADYLTDVNKNKLSDTGGVINIGNTNYYYDSWTYSEETDPDTGKTSYYYTFHMNEDANEKPIGTDKASATATIGANVNYQGAPYYMEQINEWVRCYAETYNNIMGCEGASNVYGDDVEGMRFFTGNITTDDNQYALTVDENATTYSSTDDSYYRLTAKNFAVKKEITSDAGLMGTHTDTTAGESKSDILTNLIDMATNKDVMVFRGNSAQNFLICVLGDAALNESSANSFSDIYSSIKTTVQNQRLSISGVDTDEEAAFLVAYQNAYNLSSKMISVLTEVYDQLILNTGV